MSDTLGFRLETSKIVHLPYWMAGSVTPWNGTDSACERVGYESSLIYVDEDFDIPDLRPCRLCWSRTQSMIDHRQRQITEWLRAYDQAEIA
jgi:hypothetical protein